MSYHHDNTLNIVGQGLVTSLLPVIGSLGVFSQHHGRAMGEEVNW